MCLCILFGGEFRGVGNFFLLSEFQRERDRQTDREEIRFVLFVCLFFACFRIECGSKSLQFCGCAKTTCRETCIVFSIFRVLGFEKIVWVFYF